MKFSSTILVLALFLGISANLLFRDASSVQGLKRDGGNGGGQGGGNNKGEDGPKVATKPSVKVTSTKILVSRSTTTPEKSEIPEPVKSGNNLTSTELLEQLKSKKVEPTETPELPKTKLRQPKVSGIPQPAHNGTRAHFTFHVLAKPTDGGEPTIAHPTESAAKVEESVVTRPTKSAVRVEESVVARPTESVFVKGLVVVSILPIPPIVKHKC